MRGEPRSRPAVGYPRQILKEEEVIFKPRFVEGAALSPSLSKEKRERLIKIVEQGPQKKKRKRKNR